MSRLEDFAESLTLEMLRAWDRVTYPPDAELAARAVATRRIRELACDFDCATQGPLNRYLDGAAAAKEPR